MKNTFPLKTGKHFCERLSHPVCNVARDTGKNTWKLEIGIVWILDKLIHIGWFDGFEIYKFAGMNTNIKKDSGDFC